MKKQPDQPDFISTGWAEIADLHRFSHEAMATIFDIFIVNTDKKYAEQAAWSAFDLIDRLELLLSRYIPNSDISRLNAVADCDPVPVSIETFECLRTAIEMYEKTWAAFDITIGSLFDVWLDEKKQLRNPSTGELSAAAQHTGSNLIGLNENDLTVQILTEGVRIDLGAIGKGYAVDKAAALLSEWGIDTALMSAGRSSILPIGAPSGRRGWPVTISNPLERSEILMRLDLRRTALSGSGLQKGSHIIDPRSARPVAGKVAAWCAAETAAAGDALSTAFVVMSAEELRRFHGRHDGIPLMVMFDEAGRPDILKLGPWERLASRTPAQQ
jgi:thiamine biosynthesis lipoprotein